MIYVKDKNTELNIKVVKFYKSFEASLMIKFDVNSGADLPLGINSDYESMHLQS